MLLVVVHVVQLLEGFAAHRESVALNTVSGF
jgi:hypothetical protein